MCLSSNQNRLSLSLSILKSFHFQKSLITWVGISMHNNVKPHILKIAGKKYMYVKDSFFMYLSIIAYEIYANSNSQRHQIDFFPSFTTEINRNFLCYLFICEENLNTVIIKQSCVAL